MEHVRREARLMMAEAERKKAAADRLVEELRAQVKEATNAQRATHPGDAETARDAQRATLATEQALAEAQVPTLHAKKKNARHTKKVATKQALAEALVTTLCVLYCICERGKKCIGKKNARAPRSRSAMSVNVRVLRRSGGNAKRRHLSTNVEYHRVLKY